MYKRQGFLLLVGVSQPDTEAVADKMVDKICKLRIFEDEQGKTNLSLADVKGELLVVSQFTLYADCKKGNRPSFIYAGAPELANRLDVYKRQVPSPWWADTEQPVPSDLFLRT